MSAAWVAALGCLLLFACMMLLRDVCYLGSRKNVRAACVGECVCSCAVRACVLERVLAVLAIFYFTLLFIASLPFILIAATTSIDLSIVRHGGQPLTTRKQDQTNAHSLFLASSLDVIKITNFTRGRSRRLKVDRSMLPFDESSVEGRLDWGEQSESVCVSA